MDSFIFNTFKERLLKGEVKADDTWKMYCVNSNFDKDFKGTIIKSLGTIAEINKASSGFEANREYINVRDEQTKKLKKELVLEQNYSSSTDLRSRYISECMPVYYVYYRSRETNSSDKPIFVDIDNWDDFIEQFPNNNHLYNLFLDTNGRYYRSFIITKTNEDGEDEEITKARGFYFVRTAEELRWCADLVNNDNMKMYNNFINIVLGDNIGTEVANYLSDNKIINFCIGKNPDHPFEGIFYGNGFIIKNIELMCENNTNGIIGNLGKNGIISDIRIAGSNIIRNKKPLSLTHMMDDCCDINSGLLCGKNNGKIENIDVMRNSKTFIKGFCPEIYPVGNKTDNGGKAFDRPNENIYFPNHLCFNSPGNIVPYVGYFAEGVFATNAYGEQYAQGSKSYWNSINLYNRNTFENAYDNIGLGEWSYPTLDDTSNITGHTLYYDLNLMRLQYKTDASWYDNGHLVGRDSTYKIKETLYADVSMKMHAVNRISYNTGVLIGCNNGDINNVVLENNLIFNATNVGFFGGIAGKDTSHFSTINNVYVDLKVNDLHGRNRYKSTGDVTFESIAGSKTIYLITPDAVHIQRENTEKVKVDDPIIQIGLHDMKGESVSGFKFIRQSNQNIASTTYIDSWIADYDVMYETASKNEGFTTNVYGCTIIDPSYGGDNFNEYNDNSNFSTLLTYLKLPDYKKPEPENFNLYKASKTYFNETEETNRPIYDDEDEEKLYIASYIKRNDEIKDNYRLNFLLKQVGNNNKVSKDFVRIYLIINNKIFAGWIVGVKLKELYASKFLGEEIISNETASYTYKTYGFGSDLDGEYITENINSSVSHIVVKVNSRDYENIDNYGIPRDQVPDEVTYYKIEVAKIHNPDDRFDFGYIGHAGVLQKTPNFVQMTGGKKLVESKSYDVLKRSIKNVGGVFGSMIIGNSNRINNLSANLYNDELYAFSYYKNMLGQVADDILTVHSEYFINEYENNISSVSSKIIYYQVTAGSAVKAPVFIKNNKIFGASAGEFEIKPTYDVVSVNGELMYAYDNLRLPIYDYDYTFDNRYGTLAAMCELDSSNISDKMVLSEYGGFDDSNATRNLTFNNVHLKYDERGGYLSGSYNEPSGAILLRGIRQLQYYNNAWNITGNRGLNAGLTGTRVCPYGVASPFIAEMKPTCLLFPTIHSCPGSNHKKYEKSDWEDENYLYENVGLTCMDQLIGSPTEGSEFYSLNTLVDLPNVSLTYSDSQKYSQFFTVDFSTTGLNGLNLLDKIFEGIKTQVSFYKPFVTNNSNELSDLQYFGLGYQPFTTIPWNYDLKHGANEKYNRNKLIAQYHYFGSDLYLPTRDSVYSHKLPVSTDSSIVGNDIDDGTVSSHGEFTNLLSVLEINNPKYEYNDIFTSTYANSCRKRFGLSNENNALSENRKQADEASSFSGTDIFKYSYRKYIHNENSKFSAISAKVSLTDIPCDINKGNTKYGYVFQDNYFMPEYNNNEINYDGSVLHIGTTLTEPCILYHLQHEQHGYVSASGIKTKDFDGLLVTDSDNNTVMYIDVGFGESDGSRSWSLNCSPTKLNTYSAWSGMDYTARSHEPASGLLLELKTSPDTPITKTLIDTYASISAELE